MPARTIVAPPQAIDFDAIRAELAIPVGYPPDAVAQAVAVGREPPAPRREPPDIPFVTVDPAGSQGPGPGRAPGPVGDGYLVRYAIADVAAFVDARRAARPGDLAPRRDVVQPGPEHPAASARAVRGRGQPAARGAERPAVVWTIELDAVGEPVDVRRAAGQGAFGRPAGLSGGAGRRRRRPPAPVDRAAAGDRPAAAAARPGDRHAISLDMPDAEMVRGPDGHWTLELRAVLAVEQCNAEISLLTGMCAAPIMLRRRDRAAAHAAAADAPSRSARCAGRPRRWASRGRRHAAGRGDRRPGRRPAAGCRVPGGRGPAAARRRLHPVRRRAARAGASTAGSARPYAHVTAPLRRLADRYATEVCLALHAGAAGAGLGRARRCRAAVGR